MCVWLGMGVGIKVEALYDFVTMERNTGDSVMIDGNRKCNRKPEERHLIQLGKDERRFWA